MKKYKNQKFFKLKAQAKKEAKKVRKSGWNVRVVPATATDKKAIGKDYRWKLNVVGRSKVTHGSRPKRTVMKHGGKKKYAKRDSKGRFKSIDSISRSIKADARRKSKTTPKRKGQGYKGDY